MPQVKVVFVKAHPDGSKKGHSGLVDIEVARNLVKMGYVANDFEVKEDKGAASRKTKELKETPETKEGDIHENQETLKKDENATTTDNVIGKKNFQGFKTKE